MHDPGTWFALFGHFLLLSMLSIGGAIVVAPEMHRYLVTQHGLLTDPQFSASIAIAQASPGPNVLFVAVMGYQVGGLAGASATLLGIMLPSTLFAIAASRWTHARADWLPLQAFRAGLAPVTVALMAATGWILSVQAGHWPPLALTALAAVLAWRTRLHFVVMIVAGAALGAAGWI